MQHPLKWMEKKPSTSMSIGSDPKCGISMVNSSVTIEIAWGSAGSFWFNNLKGSVGIQSEILPHLSGISVETWKVLVSLPYIFHFQCSFVEYLILWAVASPAPDSFFSPTKGHGGGEIPNYWDIRRLYGTYSKTMVLVEGCWIKGL